MENIEQVLDVVYLFVSSLGGIVILWGAVDAAWGFVRLKRSTRGGAFVTESEHVRERFVAHLLLGLEFFIGGDIISSVLRPSWQKVGMLAAIVAIRTVLSFFLRMEVSGERRRAAERLREFSE